MTILAEKRWHGWVRGPASEALRRHGSAVTCAGNGWREMAAGMTKDDGTTCLPNGGAECDRVATGFGHGRSGAGKVAAASDRWCRRLYGEGVWLRCPSQVEGGTERGARC
jgi:hypothetical protein